MPERTTAMEFTGWTYPSEGNNALDVASSASKKSKKSKKTDHSDDGGGKKKKKKSKRRDSTDSNSQSLQFDDNVLFAKAIAQAQFEDEFGLSEAFLNMKEDQDFVNTYFQEGGFSVSDKFNAFNEDTSENQEAFRVDQMMPDDSGGGDDQWIIDRESSGAEMKEYSRRRASLVSKSSKESTPSGASRNADRKVSGSLREALIAHVSEDSSKARNKHSNKPLHEKSNTESISSSSIVDLSSFPSMVEQPISGDCSATAYSDLTGLTGVFPTMRSNPLEDFDDDDDDDTDDESSVSDDEDGNTFPQYNPSQNQVGVMKSERQETIRPKFKVQFGTVSVRHFPRIIGDNPSCKAGAPISIGWNVESETKHPSPEAHDAARGHPLRKSQALVLSRDVRHDMLKQLGYSDREIAQAVRLLIRDKNRRRTTVTNLSAENLEEKMESVASGMKKLLFLKKR